MNRAMRAGCCAGWGILLAMAGCTGVGPRNWAHIDTAHHDAEYAASWRSPVLADAEHEYPLEHRSGKLFSRGIIRQHWNAARRYEEYGDNERATAHYRQILRLQPEFTPAHHRLGVIATRLGRWGDADQHFRLARLIQPRRLMGEQVIGEEVVGEELAGEKIVGRTPEGTPIVAGEGFEGTVAGERIMTEEEFLAMEERETRRAAELTAQQSLPPRKTIRQSVRESVQNVGQGGLIRSALAAAPGPERPLQQMRINVRQRTSELLAPLTSGEPGPIRSVLQPQVARNSNPLRGAGGMPVDEQWEEQVLPAESEPAYAEQRREQPTRVSDKRAAAARPSTKSEAAYNGWYSDEPAAETGDHDEELRAVPSSVRRAGSSLDGTSGIRRTSADADEGGDELPKHRLLEMQSALEAEEPEPAAEPALSDADREIADRAEAIEAQVRRQVQTQVAGTLDDRRVEAAREDLRRAQQQLVEAMLAAEQKQKQKQAAGQPVQQQPAAPRHPSISPRRTSAVPASALHPSALHPSALLPSDSDQTPVSLVAAEEPCAAPAAAVCEPKVAYVCSARPQANVADCDRAVRIESVVANGPAEVACMPAAYQAGVSQRPAAMSVLRTSHQEPTLAEPNLEPIAATCQPAAQAPTLAAIDVEESAVEPRPLRPESHRLGCSQFQAGQITCLDEPTLRRRDVQEQPEFTKKSPECLPSLLYR